MPFGKPKINYLSFKDFRKIASEKYGDLVNIKFQKSEDDDGFFPKKIQGFTQQGNNTGVSTSAGVALGSYQPSTGTHGLYATWGQYIWLIGAGAPTKQSGAATQILTTNTDGEFEQVNDDLYYTNGIGGAATNNVLKLSGGSWTEAGAAEPLLGANVVAKFLTWHNFMLFASRTVNAPGKLNVSDAGDPTTFSGNTKTFRHKIIGQKSLGEYLVIYTEKDIHVVSGYDPSTLAFRKIENSHPCVSHRSIATVVGSDTQYSATGQESGMIEHWYIGKDYPWAFNGSTFRILGKDSWDSFRGNMNTSQFANIAGYYDTENRQYRISLCTGANTTNNETWAYDANGDIWVKMPFVTASAWASHGTINPSIYWVDDNANGKCFVQNSGNAVVSPANALNGAITATDTTITVNDNSDFPTSGTIMIENEAIYYSSVDAGNTDFEGCIRGYSGTTAAAHVDTTAVYPTHDYRYRTKHLDYGNQELVKKFQVIWITTKTATTAYSLSIEGSVDRYDWSAIKQFPLQSSGATWGSFLWGATEWGAPTILHTPNNRGAISGRGKTLALGFMENASIQQTEVRAMELKARPLKIK